MAPIMKNELEFFHQFVSEQLMSGCSEMSPEQILAMWRQRTETINAVKEGLQAVDEGRTKPLDEFTLEFPSRHRISVDA